MKKGKYRLDNQKMRRQDPDIRQIKSGKVTKRWSDKEE